MFHTIFRPVHFRLLPVAGAAILLSGCAFSVGDFGSAERFQSDFHYSYELNPDGRLSVESINGSVEITGWDENKVDISGTKYASREALRDEIKIEIHNTPSSVEVRTVKPYEHSGNLGARYVIHVPRNAQVERVTTSNSSIRVRDVASALHLKSSNGSVRVENVLGDVDAHTSNSSIELDAVRGNAKMKTSNGHISAEKVGGSVDAETSNNSIKVRLDSAPPSPVRLASSNGSIDLTMEQAPKNDIRMETRNSSITLRMPRATSARVVADTSNSSISSDFDLSSGEEGRRKNHMEGTIGSGGPRIDLSSTNGSIRILKSGD